MAEYDRVEKEVDPEDMAQHYEMIRTVLEQAAGTGRKIRVPNQRNR